MRVRVCVRERMIEIEREGGGGGREGVNTHQLALSLSPSHLRHPLTSMQQDV